MRTVFCATPTCPSLTPGKHGMGYQFSGQQQLRVTFAGDLDPRDVGGYTVGAWVRLDSIPQPPDFACTFCKPWGGGDYDSYCMCVDYQGRDYFYSVAPDGAGDTAIGTSFSIDTWHHLATTWDKQTQEKTGYVDGIQVVVDTVAIGFDADALVIGADNSPPAFFWHGALDDVVAYDRVLQPGEIIRLAAP